MSEQKTAACPAELPVDEARDRYLAANGFRVEDYRAPTFKIGIFGIPFRFPNTKARQSVIPFHDLHHILTGYATNWTGEAEIGAWELRAGCRTFVAYYLNACGVLIGLFIAPRRVWRAFRAAKGQRTLYFDPLPYEKLLRMPVSELRERIGIPARGNAP